MVCVLCGLCVLCVLSVYCANCECCVVCLCFLYVRVQCPSHCAVCGGVRGVCCMCFFGLSGA